MVADRATHTFSPQRRSRCRWGSIVVPEPRLLLFPALALSLPARIIPQPTHRPPPAHCLRSAACRRRSPRSPRQVLLQRASLGRAPMETRCAALLLARAPSPAPPPKRPVVSQDARLFSWRALRYAAGTASGAAAYARLEQTGRAAVGRESGARGAPSCVYGNQPMCSVAAYDAHGGAPTAAS